MKQKGNTVEKRERRLQYLEKLMDEYSLNEKKPKTKEILAKLAAKGFKISQSRLYEDYADLARNDPFVKDLAEKTYSRYIHDCFESIEFAEREARKILEKKWTRSKSTKKQVIVEDGKETVEEQTVTEEIAEPRLAAIREIRSCAETKVKLLGGDIIKASAKSWSIQRMKDQEKIAELNQTVRELKEKSRPSE